MKLVKIGQAARILNVHINTLRNWEKSGKLISVKTIGGTRFYSLEDLKEFNPNISISKRSLKKPKVSFSGTQVFDPEDFDGELSRTAQTRRGLSLEPQAHPKDGHPLGKIINLLTDPIPDHDYINDWKTPETVLEQPQTSLPAALPDHVWEPQEDDPSSTLHPQNTILYSPSSIFKTLSKPYLSITLMSLLTFILLAGTLTVYSLISPNKSCFLFPVTCPLVSKFASTLSPVANLASQVFDPEAQTRRGLALQGVSLDNQPLIGTVGTGQVLAEETVAKYLEINSDTKVIGSLDVSGGINGLTVASSPSGILIADRSTGKTLNITGSNITLDQNFLTSSSPNLTGLNLTSTSNQLTLSSGITGILSWTPTGTNKTITLPDITDTLVTKTSTDTLTNKTISGSSNTISNIQSSALSGSYTGITGLGTIGTGTWNGTKIGTGYGGTGLTTYTTGDILYASATDTLSKLTAGSTGQVLTVSSGLPAWSTLSASGITADSLDFTEFKDSLTLDATTDIATAGYNLTTSGSGAISLNNTGTFTVAGAASLSSTLGVAGLLTASSGVTIPSGQSLTVSGNVASNLLPSTNNNYDLGSDTYQWQDAWFAGNLTIAGNLVTSGSQSGAWSSASGVVYPTNSATDDVAIGGTTSSAPFFVDGATGATVITPDSAAVALKVKAAPSGSNNIFEVLSNDASSTYFSVDSSGQMSGSAFKLTDANNAIVGTAIAGGWSMDGNTYTYRRTLTITNNSGSTMPTYYELSVTMTNSDSNQTYTNSQQASPYKDFRIAYGGTPSEIARNVSSFTSSNITFTFQLSAAISNGNSDTYYIYYSNSSLATTPSTYTDDTTLDDAEDASLQWSSNHGAFTVSQETTTIHGGTKSIKTYSDVGSIGTFSTTSQGQLPAGLKDITSVKATISGTDYVYVMGGNTGSADVSTAYKSTISSGNIGAFATTSQGQLPQNLSGATAISVVSSIDGGTEAEGILDIDADGIASTCNETGLSYSDTTCTIATDTKSTFNFTTINVGSGYTLTMSGSTFPTLKATGSVTIAGTINLAGKGSSGGVGVNVNGSGTGGGTSGDGATEVLARRGGGGGGYGGAGGNGGSASDPYGIGGNTYGTANSTDLGSGGGSGGGVSTAGSGGNGGGGIKISSSGTITVSGTISANGNVGSTGTSGHGGGGGGSGGKILLLADTVNIEAGASVTTTGNNGGAGNTDSVATSGGGGGGGGRITINYVSGLTNSGTNSCNGDTNCVAGGTGGAGYNGYPNGADGNTGAYTATVPSSNVYLMGGVNGSTAQSTVYKSSISGSDLGTFDTTSQGQLPQALKYLTSNIVTISTNNYLYVLGGNNDSADVSTVYKATITSGNIGSFSTTSQGQLPQLLSKHSSVTASVGGTNYIYVLGGINGSTAQSTVYKAQIDGSGDIGSFATTSQAQLPVALYSATSSVVSIGGTNYLYVLGGTTGSNVSTVYRAQINASTANVGAFSTTGMSQLPVALSGLSSVTATDSSINYLYVLGGNTGSTVSTVYKAKVNDFTGYTTTKTITSTDLTNKNDLSFWVYSDTTGSFMHLDIYDATGGWQSCSNFTVSSASTWEQKSCDISGVSSVNKDAVTTLRMSVDSAATNTAPMTLYFDDIQGVTEFTSYANTTDYGRSILGASNLAINAQGTGVVNVNYSASPSPTAGSGGFAVYDGTTTSLFAVDGSGNVSAIGTTGLTLSGAGADILFSGSGTHSISASSGTLEIGAFTGTGASSFSSTLGVTGLLTASGGITLPANQNLALSSGTGTYSQTFTGTTTNAMAITANSLTSGNALNISSSSTAALTGDALVNLAVSGANGASGITRYALYAANTATGTTSTNVGGYFSATGGVTDYGLQVGALTGATSYGLDIGALSGATANYGINIGNITAAATANNAAIKTGTITPQASATTYGINIGNTLAGAGTATYGINIGTNASTATTNYGMKIGAISGAGTNNYGLYVDSVTGAGTGNYAAIFAGGNVGIGITAPAQTLAVTGNQTTSGYLRVGSNTAPANTTAGDLTAVRLNLGNSAFTAKTLQDEYTFTDTSAGAKYQWFGQSTVNPASASTSEFRTLDFQMLNTATVNTGYLRGIFVDMRHRSTGNVTETVGMVTTGTAFEAAGVAPNFGTISTVEGIRVYPFTSPAGVTATGTITKATGMRIYAPASLGSGPMTLNTLYGIYIEGMTLGSTNYAIYSAGGQSYFAGNIGIGATVPGAGLDVQVAQTAAAGVDYGVRLQQTLTAAANNDTLSALYINPTFTVGAYTGLSDYGISIGAISAAGANNHGINLGNISGGTTTDYGINLGTLTGGTGSSGYQINAGNITAVASGSWGGINLGTITPTTGTTTYGINIGNTLAGAGTATYGINIGTNASTATTNYGINIGALSGAGTNNYGLYLGAVSGAGTGNYSIYTNAGTVGFGGNVVANNTTVVSGALVDTTDGTCGAQSTGTTLALLKTATAVTSSHILYNSTRGKHSRITSVTTCTNAALETHQVITLTDAITSQVATDAVTIYNPASDLGTSSAGFFNNIYGVNAKFVASTVTGGFDIAEEYPTTDSSIESGDIVAIKNTLDTNTPGVTGTGSPGVEKSSSSYQKEIIGVISANPGITLGDEKDSNGIYYKKVALSGRVPVKVSTQSGTIKAGDYLTSSSIPGVAMKAVRIGQVIGKALEDFSGTQGKILVFVNPTFADPLDLLANLTLDPSGYLVSTPSTSSLPSNSSILGTSLPEASPSSLNTYHTLPATAITTPSTDILDLKEMIASLSAQVNDLRSKVYDLGINGNIASDSASLLNLKSSILNQATDSAQLATSSAQLAYQDVLGLNSVLESTPSASTYSSLKVLNNIDTQTLSAIDMTVSNTFKSLGHTYLSDTTIAGNLSIDGTTSISGDSLSTINTLYLQNGPLANLVDLFNGAITMDKTGSIKAQKISTKHIEINNLDYASASLGTSKISLGQTSINIYTSAVTANSKIFLTATTPTGGQSLIVSKKTPGVGFTVSLEKVYIKDITFDWWVINETN